MPELPEVEVVVYHLRKQIIGGTILTLTIHRSDIIRSGHDLIPSFHHATITQVQRIGKCVVMTCQRLQKTWYLISELGMTGLWFFRENLATSPQHIHCRIALSGSRVSELHYWNPRRFGGLWLVNQSQLDAFIQRRFGPDALTISQDAFCRLIHATRGQLKAWFLNQHRLAGIGNIYANEILFRANVHPDSKGNRLWKNSCRRLHQTMQDVLRKAIAAGGSSIRDFRAPDGSEGTFQISHQVYQQDGRPCPNGCSTFISRQQTERSTFFCPTCQKKR